MFLTCHELARVFHDCCLQQDREKVLEILSEALRIHYKVGDSLSTILVRLVLLLLTEYSFTITIERTNLFVGRVYE